MRLVPISLLYLALAGLALAAGCSEDTAAEGEACETAQDCDGALVCAKLESGSDDKVCANVSDTKTDTECEREYENMTCGLVLKSAPTDAGT